MAQFFINRPVFAWVIAIAIMLAGILAISTLSISQYPEIAPPTVRISATYPGASAETVESPRGLARSHVELRSMTPSSVPWASRTGAE